MSSSETTLGATDQGLKRGLPARFVLAVTVGGIIGLGILRGPGEIAAVIRDPYFYHRVPVVPTRWFATPTGLSLASLSAGLTGLALWPT